MTTPEPPFSEWLNRFRPYAGLLLAGIPVYLLFLLYALGSPRTTDVGYSPAQPVAYSHQVHIGKLGMDCRYCHTTVETAAFASVPPTSVCMNCHAAIGPDLESIKPLAASMETGEPVRWVRVHDLPDYVYFDHRVHVRRGVGCVSCHGRIDRMEKVYQVETLSMGWCLECHRDPAPRLQPFDSVADMNWSPEKDPRTIGRGLMEEYNISPSTDCSICHR